LSEVNVPNDIFWNDNVRLIVLNEFLKSLNRQAQEAYREGSSINTLVIIDEAHRLAPREKPENLELENVKNTFKDAVRTTRKFGLVWYFKPDVIQPR
jgi:DNA helicase HerA-like ATPase